MPLAKYCPACGGEVVATAVSAGRCGGCGRDVYAHSHPTAGVFIERHGEVLLVERGVEPAKGRWDVPGGFLDDGELPEEGARREIREELGLELGPLTLVLADINPLPGRNVLDLMFETTAPEAAPRPGSDVRSCRWFPLDRLPDNLAFTATRRILERWIAGRTRSDQRLLGPDRIDLDGATTVAAAGPGWTDLPAGWRVECGSWSIHDGQLCGRVDGERPAVLWLEQPVAGDHAIAFRATTVAPHANDLNCFWEGSGRIGFDEPPGTRGDVGCTIAGCGGWWDGLSGIERYPEAGLRATGRLLPLVPGRPYEVLAGRRGATDFLFIDGRLALQLDEPGHPRRRQSHVALATWNSHVHYQRVSVHRLGD